MDFPTLEAYLAAVEQSFGPIRPEVRAKAEENDVVPELTVEGFDYFFTNGHLPVCSGDSCPVTDPGTAPGQA